ncbi:MAG TPA: acyltransferase [Cytophagaceae bacterium]|jgi:peptidoglycan/LPS O-acetylase OafA/YrhL|nr:acyltransferase [Cytophagaceae bacterium]
MQNLKYGQRPKEILFLDGLRGLAAIYVLIHHARWLLWEGYNEGYLLHPQSYTFFDKISVHLFSLFKYGHEAVLLFFVLSGFVIHLRYSLSIKSEGSSAQFGLSTYLSRRAKRILPPFILALIFTFIIDSLGTSWEPGIYHGQTPYSSINENISSNLSMSTLAGNLCFLMKIYVPSWGTNEVLWSLACEFWFYLLYPLLFLIHRKSRLISSLVVVVLFIISVVFPLQIPFLAHKIFYYLIIWWLGVLLADVYTGNLNLKFKYLSILSTALILLPINGIPLLLAPLNPLIIGLGFTGIFAILFSMKEDNIFIQSLKRIKWLGNFSYSIYIFHLPLLVFMSGWFIQKYGHLPSHFGYSMVGIFVSLGISYIFYLIGERPFTKKITSIKSFFRLSEIGTK